MIHIATQQKYDRYRRLLPIRTLSVRMVAPQVITNQQIVVNIPNVRKPVPLFIVMRALGVISDKEIIQTCLLDLDKYDYLIEYFRPCVHDAEGYLRKHKHWILLLN